MVLIHLPAGCQMQINLENEKVNKLAKEALRKENVDMNMKLFKQVTFPHPSFDHMHHGSYLRRGGS